jgi:hypothetical protein
MPPSNYRKTREAVQDLRPSAPLKDFASDLDRYGAAPDAK